MIKIGIIGAGFSGISLAAQLLLKQKTSCSVCLFGKKDQFGLGVAYSTTSPWHLLNVRAVNMGIYADDSGDFYHWLVENEAFWRKIDPSFQELTITEDSYLPRKLYALYLKSILEELKRRPDFDMVQDTVLDVELVSQDNFRVICQNGNQTIVNRVVLATGVQTSRNLPFAISDNRYMANVWKSNESDVERWITETDENTTIFIIGTGLTMLDIVTSLFRHNYKGRIVALSHHGQLPVSHLAERLSNEAISNNFLVKNGLLYKFRTFFKTLNQSKLDGKEWRQVFDGLRPHIPEIWKSLSLNDRKQFLRHLLPLWNRHRHRMPPKSAEMIDLLKSENRLKIYAGSIVKIEVSRKNNLKVIYKVKGLKEEQFIDAQYVYNCTGPGYILRNQSNEVLKNLLDREWIREDELGLGIKVNDHFVAEGKIKDRIYVMGPLLYGELFEATAVPEIRQHAAVIASNLSIMAAE